MTTPSPLYVDVHILQDVPPSNLNRDDSGSPKSARYGGVDRLRVSSQAWKRATRLHFSERMSEESLGLRTRRMRQVVSQALTGAGIPEASAGPLTDALLKQINISPSAKKEQESSYLFFFSRPQLAELATQVVARRDLWGTPDALAGEIDVRRVLGHGHSLDVALFGRMVADLPELNVDASAQVSHALATHAAPTQFDYFTAVDDSQGADETGAGMIGTVEFNSATLYRYATLNVPALIDNMGDREAALAGVEQFLRSFALSMPSGKQNTFAAHTRPGVVLVEVRVDQPVNFMSAFERPVTAGRDGYLVASARALAEFITGEAGRWGDKPLAKVASYLGGLGGVEEAFGAVVPFDDLVTATRRAVESGLGHE